MSDPVRRAATSASYSITMRLHTTLDHTLIGAVATTIAQGGGIVTAIDVADSRHEGLVVDVTCSATDSDHAAEIVAAVEGLEGVTVHKVSDRTFLLHLGGKIEVRSKVPLRTRDDLSMAYTPGVGRVSLALAEQVTSSTSRSRVESTTSIAVTTPPAAEIAVATPPTIPWSGAVCRRMVIE